MENKVKFHGEIIYSNSDIYGNRKCAMIVTCTSDAQRVRGLISGDEGNCISGLQALTDGWYPDYIYTIVKLSKKEFDQVTNGWEYMGCIGKEIKEYCNRRFK